MSKSSKKKNGTAKKVGDADRKTIFARVPPPVFTKLEGLAAQQSLKEKRRVTMQEVVVALIRAA